MFRRFVLIDIRNGVNIGVAEEYRVVSSSTNAPNSFEYGDRVSDSLCKMMQEGFIMGPFSDNNLPFKKAQWFGKNDSKSK